MNSVQLIGNLVRDPEIRFTKTGKAIALFTVAVSHDYTTAGSQEAKQLTNFIPVVAWGNLAEGCSDNLTKGNRVFVEGRMSIRSYETQDGQKRYVTEVVANFVGVSIVKHKKETDTQPAKVSEGSFDQFGSQVDDEIPF